MKDQINKDDYKDLITLIEEETGVKLEVSTMGRNIYMRSDCGEVDVMIRENYYVDTKQIVIARMFLNKRRAGIGTKLFNWIENYALSKDISRLVVESVESAAMDNLAKKLGYVPDEISGRVFEYNGDRFFAGNFLKFI